MKTKNNTQQKAPVRDEKQDKIRNRNHFYKARLYCEIVRDCMTGKTMVPASFKLTRSEYALYCISEAIIELLNHRLGEDRHED